MAVRVTLSPPPVGQGAWLKPGVLVCATGAPRPSWRELDDAVIHAGVVVGDQRNRYCVQRRKPCSAMILG